MAMMFSENSQLVLKFLQANRGSDFTADDIAKATGLNSKSINGIATALQKKNLVERVVVEGIEKKVIRLTAQGESIDPMVEKPEA